MELNDLTFHTLYPDEDACYEAILKFCWPKGLVCRHCGSVTLYAYKTRRLFKCKDCRKQFSGLSGTIFQDTHLSFKTWLLAIYILTEEGSSTVALKRRLGITKKTAWFLTQRIQEAMTDRGIQLKKSVQMDETSYGPKVRGRSTARYNTKYAIIGAVESRPYGKAVFEVVKQPDATVAREFIERHIKPGTTIHTDESRIYGWVKHHYEHATVNHSQRQYVHEGVTSNKIENNWMHTKRILKGRHIRVSGKHLSSYVKGGYQFRYNTRDLTAQERLERCLSQAGETPPLPYKQLKAKKAVQPLALRGWARKRAGLPTQTSLF